MSPEALLALIGLLTLSRRFWVAGNKHSEIFSFFYWKQVYVTHEIIEFLIILTHVDCGELPGVPKNGPPLVYFDDNFGKYGPILIIFSLLQQEIYYVHKLSYFSHFTFIMMPLYLAKQTLMLASVLHVCFNELNGPQSDLKVTKITKT